MSLLDIAPKGFDGIVASATDALENTTSITTRLVRENPIIASLAKVYLPDNIKSVEWGGMAYWDATEVSFPTGILLGEQACASMKNLRKVTCRGPILLDSRGGQFRHCTSLEKVDLRLESNDYGAGTQTPPLMFTDCTSLKEINLWAPALYRISPRTFDIIYSNATESVRVNVHTLAFKITIGTKSTDTPIDLHIYTPVPGTINIAFENARDADMYTITFHKEEL